MAVAAITLMTSAILMSRAVVLQSADSAATGAPGGVVTVVVPTPTPTTPAAEPMAAADIAAWHGLPPPRCPVSVDHPPLAKVVHHGSRADKVIALTFDDGWNSPNVLRILAILRHYKVNATFFPTGQAVKKDPTTWKSVAAAGYPIANHTYDHRDLKGLCWNLQLAELARQDAVITTELGVPLVPYMRPPYGDRDASTQFAAAVDGEQAVVVWDIDTRDWSGISPRTIVIRALAGTNGSIVIMHTMPVNTARALPMIIARYRARGFTFVTIGQLLGIDGPVPFPK